jgi:hypothetical protein
VIPTGDPGKPAPTNSFNAQDVAKVGEEVARTTLVWTLAGIGTKIIRELIDQLSTYHRPKKG